MAIIIEDQLRTLKLPVLALVEDENRGDLGSRLRRNGRAHSMKGGIGYRIRQLYAEWRSSAIDCQTCRESLTNTKS